MQERTWKILLALGIGVFALMIVLLMAGSLFSGWNHGSAWGMMRPEMAGGWHRGGLEGHPSGPMGSGFGGGGFGPFGFLFGLVGLMFRLGFLALLVLGGFWLFNRLGGSQGLSAMFSSGASSVSASVPASGVTRTTCANCGQAVQSNWQHCPHCGTPLAQAADEGPGSDDTPPAETVHA